MKLRPKLLLALSALALIPLVGVRLAEQLSASLIDAQAAALVESARTMATVLSDRREIALGSRASDPETEERRRIIALFAASDPDAAANLGDAYRPVEAVEALLSRAVRREQRVWAVDRESHVIGLAGSLRPAPDAEPSGGVRIETLPVVSSIIRPPRTFLDESTPGQQQVTRALSGQPSIERRASSDRQALILTAAQPVWDGDTITGAVVLEESTRAADQLRARAVRDVLIATGIAFVVAGSLLAWIGSHLVRRIIRLERSATALFDPDGRMKTQETQALLDPREDELGDLSRSMTQLIGRVRDYNQYLEALAGRLAHELRTPITVVRSSLDNLAHTDVPADSRQYVERAEQGVARLTAIVARLSESTRLEKLLSAAEFETVDVSAMLEGLVAGYRTAMPELTLETSIEPHHQLRCIPDALAQLMDKLVDNARDFARAGTPVVVSLRSKGSALEMMVSNSGNTLPPDAQLFRSFTSTRGDTRGNVHLGLGLYLVRLIAEAHGGMPFARNRADGSGVEVGVSFTRQ